jgi:hypothetical protein
MADDSNFEHCVQRTWRRLVLEVLPAAAAGRRWPVSTPDGFVRVLLDHVFEGPWERHVGRPDLQAVGAIELVLAIEAGERVLSGKADLSEMNRRSLAARAAPLSDEDVADLLVEDGSEPDALAVEAGLSAADLVARICAEAARRRRNRG